MKRIGFYSIALLALTELVVISALLTNRGKASQPSLPAEQTHEFAAVVAGPGRVEPISEEVEVGSEVNGRLKAVFVEEGDQVQRGQALAVLANDDYRAQVALAQAEVDDSEAELRKVVNGARSQEREEAQAQVSEALATLEDARGEMERRQRLYRKGVVSREEAERYEREFKVAQARYDATVERRDLVSATAREEDVAKAEANVARSRAQLAEAAARYQKTIVRSPIAGFVLRRHHRAGENVTDSSASPDPILTLGDKKSLRVRVDVDENDVAHVHDGDRAYVTADAFGDRRFWGHVVRIGQELGPKRIRTDRPTEKVDKKILETLIQLDNGHELPVGLQVDTFILARS